MQTIRILTNFDVQIPTHFESFLFHHFCTDFVKNIFRKLEIRCRIKWTAYQLCSWKNIYKKNHNKYSLIFNIQTLSYSKIDWWDAKDISAGRYDFFIKKISTAQNIENKFLIGPKNPLNNKKFVFSVLRSWKNITYVIFKLCPIPILTDAMPKTLLVSKICFFITGQQYLTPLNTGWFI